MKHLMSCTVGFRGRGEYTNAYDLKRGNLQDMINILATLLLDFQPGTDWRYGPSVNIQGYNIEKVTGQPLDDFGIVDTGFVPPASKLHRLVSIHKDDGTGKLESVLLEGTYSTVRPKFIGSGMAILSTVTDYFCFLQMLLNGGEIEGKRYLKASTIELMRTSVLEPGVYVKLGLCVMDGLGFGIGVAIVEKQVIGINSQKIGSYFWGGLFGTWFWIDPV